MQEGQRHAFSYRSANELLGEFPQKPGAVLSKLSTECPEMRRDYDK
jgi:hypothetical protein